MKSIEHNNKRIARKASAARRSGEVMRSVCLPEDQSSSYPCVNMLGDGHIEVENHRGVLEIGDETIRLKTALGILRIDGKGLEIRRAETSSVLIDGRISAVCYENTR